MQKFCVIIIMDLAIEFINARRIIFRYMAFLPPSLPIKLQGIEIMVGMEEIIGCMKESVAWNKIRRVRRMSRHLLVLSIGHNDMGWRRKSNSFDGRPSNHLSGMNIVCLFSNASGHTTKHCHLKIQGRWKMDQYNSIQKWYFLRPKGDARPHG